MTLDELVADAASQLDAAGVADEALAELRPARSLGPITRPARFLTVGRAWRLGEVLVTRDGQLLATAKVIRAVVPKDFSANKSPAEEHRRALQRAAARGPFLAGESVNYDYRPALGHTVFEQDGSIILRLPYAEVPLEGYLADRVKFAISPGPD